MFDIQTTQTILILVTLVLAGWAVYKSYQRGEQVTLSSVVEQVKEAVPVAEELQAIALTAVQAAEQLKNTGKLPDNDAAFEYALNYIRKHVPLLTGIDNNDIVTAIESAVFVVNNISKQVGDLSAKT